MLDLTHFILNSSSSTEASTNTQDILGFEQPLELADDSVDKDNLIIDPSSFVLLFAEILANTPVKSDVDSDSSVPDSSSTLASSAILNASIKEEQGNTEGLINNESLTDKIDLASIEDLISTKNEPPINSDAIESTTDTQVVNANYQKNTRPSLLDNPFNTDSKSEQLPLNSLENNVAIAWINSESFQPPQSISATNEAAVEFLPELEALLVESTELPEIELKKDMLPKSEEVLEPVDAKAAINAKEDWPKSLQLLTNTSFSSSEKSNSNLKQGSQIDSTQAENSQYMIQPDLANKENQRAIEMPVKSLEIPVDLANSQWANKFSEHITWLGHQGIKSALIKIHPEDLGPLEISIKVVKDSASVNINSHSSHVRDLVDQALPKLREMMSEQGLNLSDVHIGSDSNPRQFSHHNAPSEEVPMTSSDAEVQLTPLTKKAQKGIIDYFA